MLETGPNLAKIPLVRVVVQSFIYHAGVTKARESFSEKVFQLGNDHLV
jgi:hypothetical protein